MYANTAIDEASAQNAAATGLALAAAALRYPDENLAQAIWSGAFEDAFNKALEGCGAEPVLALPARRKSAAVPLHDLRVESTNLFYGMPHAAVSPYESVWRAADEGRRAMLFVDDVALDAKRAYREAGLEPTNASEPCDHIATELEFAATLLSRGDAASAAAFAKRHLGWVGSFASEVVVQAPVSFYAKLCACLPDLASAAIALSH